MVVSCDLRWVHQARGCDLKFQISHLKLNPSKLACFVFPLRVDSAFSPAQPWAIHLTHPTHRLLGNQLPATRPFPRAMASNLLLPLNIAKTVSYLRLADGSGTTLVEQVCPALGWRCRCSLFRSREARKGTSFGVEHLRDLVWSSRSSEQRDTVFAIQAIPSASTRTDRLFPPTFIESA